MKRIIVIVLALTVFFTGIAFAGGKQEPAAAAMTEKQPAGSATEEMPGPYDPDGLFGLLGIRAMEEGHPLYGPEGAKMVPVPADKYKKDPPYTIGISFTQLGNNWIIQQIESVKTYVDTLPDVELIFFSSDGDDAKQLSDVQDLITRGVDALLIETINGDIVKLAVEQCEERDIILSISAPEADWNIEPIFTLFWDFAMVYVEASEWLAETINYEGNVWYIRGAVGISDYMDVPAREVFDKYPGIEVTRYGNGGWDYEMARKTVESWALVDTDVDAIYSAGGQGAQAAIDVLEEYGIDVPPIIGQNNNGFLKAWKRSGAEAYVPLCPNYGMHPAVIAMVEMLRGNQVPDKIVLSEPGVIITEEMRDKFIREDMNDDLWLPTTLTEEQLQEMYAVR
jgi:ribose transport system substrate-binding protein